MGPRRGEHRPTRAGIAQHLICILLAGLALAPTARATPSGVRCYPQDGAVLVSWDSPAGATVTTQDGAAYTTATTELTIRDLDNWAPVNVSVSDGSGAPALCAATPLPPLTAVLDDSWAPGFLTSSSTYLGPAIGDVNGDGALDLVVGTANDGFLFFDGMGATSTQPFPAAEGSHLRPQLLDWDGDGDTDLVYANGGGDIHLMLQDAAGDFAHADPNPFDGLDIDGGYGSVAVADYDADGDWDLMSTTSHIKLYYFENDGSDSFSRSQIDDGSSFGDHGLMAPCDADGDGDVDVLLGVSGVGVHTLENIGDRYAPAWDLAPADDPLPALTSGLTTLPSPTCLSDYGVVVGVQTELDARLLFEWHPSRPLDVAVTAATYGAVEVAWAAPADDGGAAVTLYTVVTNASDPSVVNETSVSLSASVPAPAGVPVRLAVRASNAQGRSRLSAWTEAVVPLLPAPEGLQCGIGDYSAALSWSAVDGADAYVVALDGQEVETAALTASFSSLSNYAEYVVQVRARSALLGDGAAAECTVRPQPPWTPVLDSTYLPDFYYPSQTHFAPAFGDVDGDGAMDMVLGTNGYLVLYRAMAVAWDADWTASISTSGTSLKPTVVDFDGDGDQDIVYAQSTGVVHVLLQDASGGFAEPAVNPFDGVTLSMSYCSVSMADVDGDADLDLFYVCYKYAARPPPNNTPNPRTAASSPSLRTTAPTTSPAPRRPPPSTAASAPTSRWPRATWTATATWTL